MKQAMAVPGNVKEARFLVLEHDELDGVSWLLVTLVGRLSHLRRILPYFRLQVYTTLDRCRSTKHRVKLYYTICTSDTSASAKSGSRYQNEESTDSTLHPFQTDSIMQELRRGPIAASHVYVPGPPKNGGPRVSPFQIYQIVNSRIVQALLVVSSLTLRTLIPSMTHKKISHIRSSVCRSACAAVAGLCHRIVSSQAAGASRSRSLAVSVSFHMP
ncbi:hypothetical protein C8Q73DRAFT_24042 [Cubamyces lactineus]|nr:hypothetical protein C8Q73DRAFT_24042 [Cubamyces lactineus]